TTSYTWTSFRQTVPQLLNAYRAKPIVNSPLCIVASQYASMTMPYRFEKDCEVTGWQKPLIKERNEAWMLKLPSLFDNNNCFLAVGMAHLFNTCGVIQQLRNLGYTVEPVPMK